MKIRLLFATLSVLFAAGAAPAFADIGETRAATRVYVNQNINSAIVGVLPSNTPVEGQCYRNAWCQITGGGLSGWVESIDVNMRVTAQPWPQWPSEPQRPQPGPAPWPTPTPVPQPQPLPPPPLTPPSPPPSNQAQVCFFSEANFAGSSFCVQRGNTYSRLSNWDNIIRSVQVSGGARVRMCADANLTGECANLRDNTSPLPGWVDGRTSSLRVY